MTETITCIYSSWEYSFVTFQCAGCVRSFEILKISLIPPIKLGPSRYAIFLNP